MIQVRVRIVNGLCIIVKHILTIICSLEKAHFYPEIVHFYQKVVISAVFNFDVVFEFTYDTYFDMMIELKRIECEKPL